MFFGQLPHNLETTQSIKRLRKVCSPSDYPFALLLHLRFGMASGRSEESDGILPRAQVVGLHEGSRRVANRLIGHLVEAGLWEQDDKYLCDVTWTKRYKTTEQISKRRAQVRENVARLRERDARARAAAGPVPCRPTTSPPGGTPVSSDDTSRTVSSEQVQQLTEECNVITGGIDTSKALEPRQAPPPQGGSRPAQETTSNLCGRSESIPCPRPTSAGEDLQRWLASNGLGVQMTGVQAAMVAKLGTTSPGERGAALAMARQWAERKGCEVTAGRVLRCLTDYRAEYEAEMRRPRQVVLPSARAVPRGSSSPLGRIAEAGILGGQLLQAQLAAKHNKS